MVRYRAYVLDAHRRVIAAEKFDCADEDAARQRALEVMDGDDVELWQLDRLVAVFKAKPKKDDGSKLERTLMLHAAQKARSMNEGDKAKSCEMNTTADTARIIKRVSPILADKEPEAVRVALATLVAILIAGSHPALRGEQFELFVGLARELVSIEVARMTNEGRYPPDWRP